jgi:hypothetical protein
MADATLVEDGPPAYVNDSGSGKISQAEIERIGQEAIRRHHLSNGLPFNTVPGGIPDDIHEDWERIKRELNFNCVVIDKLFHDSPKKPGTSSRRKKGQGSRFYNIYNTYVYGDSFPMSPIVTAFGVMIVVLIAVGPFMPISYVTPGTPTYADRVAWVAANSFSPAEAGFEDTPPHAIFGLLGRVLFGAGQIAANRIRPPLSLT